MPNLNPDRVESALRDLISYVDYDLHKQLESDEETGEDIYPELVQQFIDSYEDAEG